MQQEERIKALVKECYGEAGDPLWIEKFEELARRFVALGYQLRVEEGVKCAVCRKSLPPQAYSQCTTEDDRPAFLRKIMD